MNLLLLDAAEVESGIARLHAGDRRARHLVEVLRGQQNDRVRAGVVRGATFTATVARLDEQGVELHLEDPSPAPAPPPIDLVLALPRPKAFRRVLQTAAALGVGRIEVVNAWRVERSYFASPRLAPPDMDEQLRLGCEQGGHTWIPEIQVHERLLPFLESLAAAPARPEARILAHPGAAAGIEAALGDDRHVLLAIGPEGGWIETELASFGARGFIPASIVRGILRTEDAVAAALAQVELARRLGQ